MKLQMLFSIFVVATISQIVVVAIALFGSDANNRPPLWYIAAIMMFVFAYMAYYTWRELQKKPKDNGV